MTEIGFRVFSKQIGAHYAYGNITLQAATLQASVSALTSLPNVIQA
jgi:hypothetical protein